MYMPSKLFAMAVVGVGALVLVGGVIIGGTGNVLEPKAEANPGISVERVGSSGWVGTEETLRPTIALANDGEQDRVQTVEIMVDGDDDGEFEETVAARKVTLSAGETKQTTFTFDAPGAGEYQYAVVAEGEVITKWSVDVLESPTFDVEEMSVDSTSVQGDDANVTMRLVNEGDYRAERTVVIKLADETVAERSISLGGNTDKTVSMSVPTANLEPGVHEFTVTVDDEKATGDFQVLKPATFTVDELGGELNVTRGTNATIEATVTNTGEVAGTQTVSVRGLEIDGIERTVSLDHKESKTVEFTVPTDELSAGTYSYSVVTQNDEVTAADRGENETSTRLRVRDGYFKVSYIRGDDLVNIGDPITLAANVTNTGDATDTQNLKVGIDLVGGPTPELIGVSKNVTLEPGEETSVEFRITSLDGSEHVDELEDLQMGSYIYGIYSEDTNATSVFDAGPGIKVGSSLDNESNSNQTTAESVPATRDEITQEKYGIYYKQLSGETKMQIDEIYERQPFASGLGITEVLTREEIARQKYGLDVKIGDKFEFSEIELELQQQIEADFDAQFTSQSGDRIESLDELAQQEYDKEYEQLTDEQKERIMELYEAQFD